MVAETIAAFLLPRISRCATAVESSNLAKSGNSIRLIWMQSVKNKYISSLKPKLEKFEFPRLYSKSTSKFPLGLTASRRLQDKEKPILRMTTFKDLPIELLRIIGVHLDAVSLKSFSLVDIGCRLATMPELFRTLKVTFSENGLKRLEEIAASPLAPYIKFLHYDASELVDPRMLFDWVFIFPGLYEYIVIQHWDYFSACVYTPQEYARDQADFRWDLRGKSFSYKSVFSYFGRLARIQDTLLKERKDIQVLSKSLPRLSSLTGISFTLKGAREDQLLWFANRIFLDSDTSFPLHVEALFKGMAAAYANGVVIRSIEIDGIQSLTTFTDSNLLKVTKSALICLEYFKLVNSPGLLDLFCAVPLPSLRHLELVNCWLTGPALIKVMGSHGGHLRHAHIQGINISQQRADQDNSSLQCFMEVPEFWTSTKYVRMVDKIIIIRDPRT